MINIANEIIESWLYGKKRMSKRKRYFFENINRTLMVLATIFIALMANKNLSSFLALLGASTCTPIAFTLPALFHYRLCSFTTKEKVIDLSIVGVSIVIGVFCSIYTIINW